MAAELFCEGGDEMDAAGLIVLGYPFHPGQARRMAGEVLKQITTPTLLLQGSAIPSVPAPSWPISPSHPPYRSTG